MNGFHFTPKQEAAITQDGNLIVSAAAGSGKTRVLTERLCRAIYQGTPIEKLLVLTFTRGAAGEMKERIRAKLQEYALGKGCPEEPDEQKLDYLCKQAADAGHADISTVHSFCSQVLRRHGYLLGLDAAFRTLDDAEKQAIVQRIREGLQEQYGRERVEDYLQLLHTFDTEQKLWAAVEKVCGFLEAQPEPEAWLERAVTQYEDPAWRKSLLDALAEHTGRMLHSVYEDYLPVRELIYPEWVKVFDVFDQDLETLQRLQGLKEYECLRLALQEPGWGRMSFPRNIPDEEKKPIQDARKAMKEAVEKLQKNLQRPAWEEHQILEQAGQAARMLQGLVLDYRKTYQEEKQRLGVIDFTDMEHFALRLLKVPEIAEEYRQKYEFIAVDEYQDSNAVQEALIASIQRENNLFFVGDIKQSIYGFRLAEPALFKARCVAFEEDPDAARIDMNDNFRSAPEVIACVNEVFGTIMREETCGISYSGGEVMQAARTGCRGFTELHLVSKGMTLDAPALEEEVEQKEEQKPQEPEDSLLEDLQDIEVQARLVAKRIRDMQREGFQVVGKDGTTRDLTYRDVAILLRANTGAQEIAETLAREGIPCYAQVSGGYFESIEVMLALNILRVIDNPLDDIPLVSVLYSSVGGFSMEELAAVRAWYRKKGSRSTKDHFHQAFYDAAEATAWDGLLTQELAIKCATFHQKIISWRQESMITSVGALLSTILEETGLYAEMGVLPGGRQRRANLDTLIARAYAFEQGQERGISAFLRFMDTAGTSNVKMGSSQTVGADVVRVMTIHGSKGQEFPVVFMLRLEKGFNNRDQRENLCLHGREGLGLKFIRDGVQYDTAARRAIANWQAREQQAEEMRILYVGMTRAMQCLIMVAMDASPEALLHQPAPQAVETRVNSANNYLKWLMLSPGAFQLTKTHARREFLYAAREGNLSDFALKEEAYQQAERLKTYLSWQYPHQGDEVLPTKAGVSSVVHRQRVPERLVTVEETIPEVDVQVERAMAAKPAETMHLPEFSIPSFARGKRDDIVKPQQFTALERGTAVHAVLERLPLGPQGVPQVLACAESMCTTGVLSAGLLSILPLEDISWYTSTGLYARQAASIRAERELPFTYAVPGKALYQDSQSEEKVLLQGIIDCCFLEEGGWVLVDYKTDHPRRNITPTDMAREHTPQLALYARALEVLTGIPVKEQHVVLLSMRQVVCIAARVNNL